MNVCDICGIPLDANYFDNASIQPAPVNVGDEVELARYQLHPQYCGRLLCFAQYAEPQEETTRKIVQTPGYEWAVLCNNQPRDPYLPSNLILNPWGENNLSIHLRLEEGCAVRFVVRKVSSSPEIELAKVGGRLQGRYWYNKIYGGLPNRL
ncbi:MAG: hypothetical protein F6K18_04625 [Okeania sp. SIO2C2]|uniref:hypothetical protein n=1 Tax=Okeania sp. SIO2C2 TaxID=2607787 RepID=UPI0013B8C972|nr:hypothetical protein [Okeania sp. SIO2C2]NEP86159.1 hypothetical protein [Okeania sp. SIO2C2]